jgi:hypothetical protein
MGQDLDWMDKSPKDQALRYFASNALVNLHAVTHASRCFKKGSECYANLPEQRFDETTITHNEEYDTWFDYMGHTSKRNMFKISPRRATEDAFMNTHNKTLTLILGCNTNVMVAMNGCSVFYVTGYNAKSNQKEETAAFEVISEVVVKHLEKQVKSIWFTPMELFQLFLILCISFCYILLWLLDLFPTVAYNRYSIFFCIKLNC